MAGRTPSRLSRPIALALGFIVLGGALVAAVAGSDPRATGPDATETPSGVGRASPTPEQPAPQSTSGAIPQRDAPATAWVSVDGDDGAAGTAADPWRSPQRAVDSGAGRIELLPGRHAGFIVARPGLVITGSGPAMTTVVGQVQVNADDVEIRDMAITGVDEPYEAGLLVDGATGVRVTGVHVHDNSFGIHLRDAPGAIIEASEISGNGAGIEIHGRSGGTLISDNRIHHNDRPVDASRGANGIVFFRSEGGVDVRGNELYSNINPSPAPGTDAGGGAFEVYATTDVVIADNRISDSSILETGTEDELPCTGLVFMRNVAWRGPSPGTQEGIVLRCAANGLIAHNTVDGFDRFAVDVIHDAGPFAGSVDGLRVVNNIFVHGRAYSIDNEMPAGVVIDHNLLWNPDSDAGHGEFLAYVAGHGNTRSADDLRAWGIDRNGIVADPQFVDRGARDYRLGPGSPGIDAGIALPELAEDVADGRPDLGRWEAP